MAEVTPLPAASVIVLRDGPLEVLLTRRHDTASFVPNAWVFPGGIAEERDGGDLRVTAVRELFEEVGIRADPSQLVRTSRWITPQGIPKRFDTDFYLLKVERDVPLNIDPVEVADAIWIAPADALSRKDLKMVFPTIKNLEAIAGFISADELIAARRGATIEAIEPILVNGKPTLR